MRSTVNTKSKMRRGERQSIAVKQKKMILFVVLLGVVCDVSALSAAQNMSLLAVLSGFSKRFCVREKGSKS